MNFKFEVGSKVKIKLLLSEFNNFIGVIHGRFYNPITNSDKYILVIGETMFMEVFDEKYLELYEMED